MKVSAILKGAKDNDNRIPVAIRINDGGKRSYKTLTIRVVKEQFKKGKVINHPKAKEYNDIIKKKIVEYEAGIITATPKKADPDFLDYAQTCIDNWRSRKKKEESTLEQYASEINKLRDYKEGVKMSGIGNAYFNGLLSYCYKKGNVENTAWKTFSKVHAILEQARKDGLLVSNPLDDYEDRPKYTDPTRDYLTKEQLTAVERFAGSVDSPAQKHATLWFLIGCYTGLRYSDMKTFNKKDHIKSGRLIKENIKTGEIVSLPFTSKIKALFEAVEYKPLSITNEAYNRMLKVIAKRCDIEMNMTAHTSRHTCGMLCANAGISIEVTAKILGHSSTKHTGVYYKISNQRIDSEIQKILF